MGKTVKSFNNRPGISLGEVVILTVGYQWINEDQSGPELRNLFTAVLVTTQALKQLVPAFGKSSANEKRR